MRLVAAFLGGSVRADTLLGPERTNLSAFRGRVVFWKVIFTLYTKPASLVV